MAGYGEDELGAERKKQLQVEQACQWKLGRLQAGEMKGDSLVPERVCLGSQRHGQGAHPKRSH